MPFTTSHKLIIIALAASAQEIPTGRCNTTDGDAALAFYDVACQLYAVCRNQSQICGAYGESWNSFGLDHVNCSRFEAAAGGNDAADISDKNELVIGDQIIRTELTSRLEHHEDERIRNNPMLQQLGPNLQDSLDAALQGGFPWESGEVAYLLHEALPKMLKYAEDNVENLLSDEKKYRADLYDLFAAEVDAFVEASVLPPAGDDWGAGARRWAYLRAMNYGFMGQWLPMWTERGLELNKKSQEWMMRAFEVDPRWAMRKVEMPFEHDGVRVPLNGYFISPRDETEAAARPLTLSSAGGLDWTSAGMVPWVMPLVEEGFNVLIYEGPGQGDTLRVHNYAFIPEWDQVMKAVYEFAASSDLPWDRSRGVGHGTASFAGQLGLQACLVAGDDVGVTACYMSPTTASDARVLGGLVWDPIMDVTRTANYLKEDHPAVFDAMGSVPAQYSGYSNDGRIYGADPLVAGLLTCGVTGHDALTFPDDWGFEARANAPMSFLGGDELLSLHGDYWLYALAASEIKRKGWTIAEVMLDADKKLAMANYAGLRLLTEFKMEEEEVREPRATRDILLMGSTDDSMFSYELVHHIYDALPEASRAAATVNVYDEEAGGALHCREGAITKSQYTVVAPFLAAALGEASTDAPTPGGSDGADGRSHSVLLWAAVFLLLF